MRLQAGLRLGPYEVAALLGSGGMAEVYRARDTRLARDVALKMVTEALSTDPDLVVESHNVVLAREVSRASGVVPSAAWIRRPL